MIIFSYKIHNTLVVDERFSVTAEGLEEEELPAHSFRVQSKVKSFVVVAGTEQAKQVFLAFVLIVVFVLGFN